MDYTEPLDHQISTTMDFAQGYDIDQPRPLNEWWTGPENSSQHIGSTLKKGETMITREQFEQYVEIYKNAEIDIEDISAISEFTGLDEDIVKEIKENYDALAEEYPEVVEEYEGDDSYDDFYDFELDEEGDFLDEDFFDQF